MRTEGRIPRLERLWRRIVGLVAGSPDAQTGAAPSVISARDEHVPIAASAGNRDCGAALLEAMLRGYGIAVDRSSLEARLQGDDVTGISIDLMEIVANDLGLSAQQIMMPANFLYDAPATELPAIVVMQRRGSLYYQLHWRVDGQAVEVLDCGRGRVSVPVADLETSVYVHERTVPAAGVAQWFRDDGARRVRQHLEHRGVPTWAAAALVNDALAKPGWRRIAALDAVIRAIGPAPLTPDERVAAIRRLVPAAGTPEGPDPSFWTLRDSDKAGELILRGAVLLQAIGRKSGT